MRARLSFALVHALLFIACDGDVDTPSDAGPPAAPARALVVLPDTQFYACAYGEIFQQQTRWVAEQRDARGIGAVLHTGDIVDSDIDPQWQLAADSFQALAGSVPFMVTTGNHDLSPGRHSLFPRYFKPSELDDFELGAESYEPGQSDNSYAVVRLADREWLVLGLEFGPRDRVVDWAAQVLREHADLPAILFTHAYLYSDGSRYDRAHDPHQLYHPDDYAQTPEQGINDGEDMWNKLVVPHENVRLVLSGHVIPDGIARSSVRRASGGLVHQVLANYQHCDACPCAEVEGGGGYLRLLEFAADAIKVSTYSPHYDRWLRDDDNEFALELSPTF
ncbi:MAG TPA: metallophosphoesterase [Polyangiales bacterium]|nr:metallophosphoesterase [Polyangiales bacterium]